MTKVCIERSGCVALGVVMSSDVTEDWLLAFRPHIGRLRTLIAFPNRTSYPLLVTHFSDTPAPNLIRLDLTMRGDHRTHPFPHLFRAHTPSLTDLYTKGFSTSQPTFIAAATNLLSLELDLVGTRISITGFLDILEANPKLEKLIIVSSLTPEAEDGNPERIVSLARLQTFVLARCASQMILRHLSLPANTHIIIHRSSITEGGILEEILPPSLTHLNNLNHIKTIGFRSLDLSKIVIDGCRGKLFESSVTITAKFSHAYRHLQTARMLKPLPSFQPLSVIHVEDLWWDERILRLASRIVKLGELLVYLPTLHNLVLLGCKCDDIFRALMPTEDAIPSPSLTTLSIYDYSYFLPLIELASARKAHGVPFKKVTVFCPLGQAYAQNVTMPLERFVEVVENKAHDEVPQWPFADIPNY